MQKAGLKRKIRPSQRQNKPGLESKMRPLPIFDNTQQKGCDKLKGKIAFISGGDSGIGRAVAVLFAKEGADIAISYLNEHSDAKETKEIVETWYNRKCLLVPGDLGKEKNCRSAVAKTIREYGRIDILVNNAATHFQSKSLADITTRQLLKTFYINIFSFFWVTKAALPYMKPGSSIINTTSVTAYRGSAALMDYASTKGAIVSFTRSLSANLIPQDIRVNAVAPGPIWTPLIPSTMPPKKSAQHGSDAPMHRAGEPVEVASCYLFLACDDASYMTGQVLHPNGGEVVNG
jgi:NAD(P)-dependent dehydrogenase (short-subunit alcohol dehydrogenase family)